MAGRWTDLFSYVTGAVRYKDLAMLALVSEESRSDNADRTYFLIWDSGEWEGFDAPKPWGVVSMCVCEHPIEQAIALGSGGQIFCVGSGQLSEEILEPKGDPPGERPTMRGIRSIGGKAYAVGMNRRVYRRDEIDSWVRIDQGARPPRESDNIVGFESIDGFNESDIYAVGWDGAIWQFDGSIWSELASPTNLVLSDVCCGGDGLVYACARTGILLRGRDQKWEVVEHELDIGDIWNLAWFDGQLYLSTMRNVYTLHDDSLRPVDMGDDTPNTCFHLTARDGVLWSVGAKDVMSFDGRHWTRID